jgi:hypothetical protein
MLIVTGQGHIKVAQLPLPVAMAMALPLAMAMALPVAVAEFISSGI